MRNVSEVDVAVGELGVPHLDQLVDHALVAAAALPHDEIGGGRGNGGRGEADGGQAKRNALQYFRSLHFLPPIAGCVLTSSAI